MLKSELQQLEILISEISTITKSDYPIAVEKILAAQASLVQTRCKELKNKWVQELFSSAKDLVIFRYVQFHQAGITNISNQLSEAIPEKKELPLKSIGFYKVVLQELEQLLAFLKDQCYKYFDPDFSITIYRYRKEREQIYKLSQELSAYTESNVDTLLLKVICIISQEVILSLFTAGTPRKLLVKKI